MASPTDELTEPPTSIEPYAVMEVPRTASAAEIRTAYKKLALRLHPDKAAPSEREKAHKAFQDLAFAYAILSEPARRSRYDRTGNTAESLDLDDDDFNWADFFRAQYEELVTTEKIQSIKATYQNSAEERSDVLEAYRKGKGNLGRVFADVMLSSVLDDEERFRGYIDEAIAKGEVEAYKKYTAESERSKERRRQNARKETVEAMEHAKDLGLYDKIYGDSEPGPRNADDSTGADTEVRKQHKKGKSKEQMSAKSEASLAALIQGRSAARAGAFLDDLEAKYAGGARGQKRKVDEPSEDAFAEMAKRPRKGKEKEKGKHNANGERGSHGREA